MSRCSITIQERPSSSKAICLVLATTNLPANWLAEEVRPTGRQMIEIGDCAAPRQAPYAFYEGRKAALAL